MESYIRTVLNKHDKSGRLYQLNHYTTGVILHGQRDQVARQGLKNVSIVETDMCNVSYVSYTFNLSTM